MVVVVLAAALAPDNVPKSLPLRKVVKHILYRQLASCTQKTTVVGDASLPAGLKPYNLPSNSQFTE